MCSNYFLIHIEWELLGAIGISLLIEAAWELLAGTMGELTTNAELMQYALRNHVVD